MANSETTHLVDDPSRLPLALRVLRNPIVIVLATYVTYYTIGLVILGNQLVVLFLETSDFPVIRPWSARGMCGLFHGWQDFEIILCRLFYAKEMIYLSLIPFSVLAFLAWVGTSVVARRALWLLNRPQRRIVILAMYLVAATGLLMGLAHLPRYTLFTGPLHGFHPLGPTLRSISSFITPIIFWVLIEKAETRYLTDTKDS